MRTLGNILWHIPFLGFITASVTWLLGALLTVTVVAAPVGLGLMELGKFLFAPFGCAMVKKSELKQESSVAWKTYSTIVMIVYLPLGIIIAIGALLQIVVLAFTIVGIPVAIVVAKSLSTYLNPVGRMCISAAAANELQQRRGKAEVDRLTA